MSAALWLCTKSRLGGADTFINDVACVLVNKDSAQTTLQVQTAAALAASAAAGAGGHYPATYFDTVTNITTFTGSPLLPADGDSYVIVPNGPNPVFYDA